MPPRKRPAAAAAAAAAAASPASDDDLNISTTVMDMSKLMPPKMNDTSLGVMNSIAGMRRDFVDIGVQKRKEYAEKLADLTETYTQRIEEEEHEQETHVRDLLERLYRALEKKAACEEAMTQVIASVKEEMEAFQLAIGSVYAERLQQCEEGAAMADQAQAGGSGPLMRGEKEARTRVDNLME
ncbi:hypothetical protein PG990_006700 [Apiospora arundinis]